MAALLGQIGGRKIDRDVLGWQRKTRGDQRSAHPLAALSHRLVGQAHDIEPRQARRNLHLHVDRHGLDAQKGHSGDARCHAVPSHG